MGAPHFSHVFSRSGAFPVYVPISTWRTSPLIPLRRKPRIQIRRYADRPARRQGSRRNAESVDLNQQRAVHVVGSVSDRAVRTELLNLVRSRTRWPDDLLLAQLDLVHLGCSLRIKHEHILTGRMRVATVITAGLQH